MNVLFVCTGNTCRSPMAEAILKKDLPTVSVKSAGIYANDGSTINQHAHTVLSEIDIDVEHTSSSVTSELLDWADVVLTMTLNHKLLLSVHFPEYHHKAYTLIEYANQELDMPNESTLDIEDPFGQSISTYRETLGQLESYMPALIKALQQSS